jgi:predicted nucleotidyltransferase component of viral defense system
MSNESQNPLYHEDLGRLRAALGLAEATSGFSARLVEKDYYCSLLLHDLSPQFDQGLVFKGGTCLSKVHTNFFRLSEDLDFCVSLSTDALASERRKAASPLKDHFAGVPNRHACFRVAEPLKGHNSSRQYNGRLAYRSVVTGEDDFISLEISLREPVLLQPETLPARTILVDPDSGQPALPYVSVRVLPLLEAYAEKVRAALTRRDPAIRDFFDIDNAAERALLNPRDPHFLDLVVQKLTVFGNVPLLHSEARVAILQAQIEPQLRPVLRAADYEEFQLQRVVILLDDLIALLPSV